MNYRRLRPVGPVQQSIKLPSPKPGCNMLGLTKLCGMLEAKESKGSKRYFFLSNFPWDEISSRDDKKEKKTYKHFILGWNFTRYHEQNCIIILQWYIIRYNKMYYYESLSSALWYLMKAESVVRITFWGSIMLYFSKNIYTQIYKT